MMSLLNRVTFCRLKYPISALAISVLSLSISANEDGEKSMFNSQNQSNFFESMSIEKLSDKENGNGLIRAKAKEEFIGFLPMSFLVETDNGFKTLRDDGLGGDEKARDGVFSLVADFDFSVLQNRRERVENIQNQVKDDVVIFEFDQHQLVKKINPKEIVGVDLDSRINLTTFGVAAAINPEASLVIRAPSVVQDPSRTFHACTGGTPGGVWTFRHLMEEMANTTLTGITASDFTRQWLTAWETNQTINGFIVPDRNFGIHNVIIDDWEAASGGPGMPLDLDRAPFQLLAIVNRVDLRGNAVYGNSDAGEARFVFGVLDSNCNPRPMTIIFEYGIEKNSCSAVKNWGQQWADLDSLGLGSPAYNAALEHITESFVAANSAPSKPNGNALNQLRTNEIALSGPWELREFIISAGGWNQHFLAQDTVKQTPDTVLNGSIALRDYVNFNAADIITETHQVPLRFPMPSDPFLGGHSLTPGGFFWDHPSIAPREARHKFSLNTCNGCHAGETNTPFTHIFPTGGLPAALSGFMTGITVADPADGAPSRSFDELTRRATDLDDLINSSCLVGLVREELRSIH